MATMQYHASSLADIAAHIQSLADKANKLADTVSSPRYRAKLLAEGYAYEQCVEILKNTRLENGA